MCQVKREKFALKHITDRCAVSIILVASLREITVEDSPHTSSIPSNTT